MKQIFEQNRSFIITLALVISMIVLFFLVKSSTLWELIRTNFLYTLTLLLLTSTPWFVVQKLEWAPTKQHKFGWFLFLLCVTLYYAISGEPNWLGLLGDLVNGHIIHDRLQGLFFGTLTYVGLIYLFYFLLSTVKSDFFHYNGEEIGLFTYSMWMVSFLIYLNATISIINPLFDRPF